MYRPYDTENGVPPRIYRTPGEIKRDIRDIADKIEETNEMINIRGLLLDMLTSENSASPEKLIPDLEEAVAEAREALINLGRLKEELTSLEEELGEVKCLLRI
jgi:hypothetical protein